MSSTARPRFRRLRACAPAWTTLRTYYPASNHVPTRQCLPDLSPGPFGNCSQGAARLCGGGDRPRSEGRRVAGLGSRRKPAYAMKPARRSANLSSQTGFGGSFESTLMAFIAADADLTSATGPVRALTARIEPPRAIFDLRLREVWAYRELLHFFVWRDLKVRYKQTAIGVAWVVLQPLLSMGVFTIFFGRLAKLPSDGLPYPVFYFAALVPWTYFASTLTATTNVVVENQRVITKVYFPRVILPLSTMASGLVDFGIGFVVLLVMLYGYGLRPGAAAVLWVPLLVLLMMGTVVGIGLWLSALNALYRDVRYVTPFLVQFWMLASP